MTACPQCGADNPYGAAFCGGCGRALNPAAMAPPDRPRRRYGWLIGLCLFTALILAASAAAVYFVWPRPTAKPPTITLEQAIVAVVSDPKKITSRALWSATPDGAPEKALIVEDQRIHYFIRDAQAGWREAAQTAEQEFSPDTHQSYNPTWAAFTRKGQGCLVGFRMGTVSVSFKPLRFDAGEFKDGPAESGPEVSDDMQAKVLRYLDEVAPEESAAERKATAGAIVQSFFNPAPQGAPPP